MGIPTTKKVLHDLRSEKALKKILTKLGGEYEPEDDCSCELLDKIADKVGKGGSGGSSNYSKIIEVSSIDKLPDKFENGSIYRLGDAILSTEIGVASLSASQEFFYNPDDDTEYPIDGVYSIYNNYTQDFLGLNKYPIVDIDFPIDKVWTDYDELDSYLHSTFSDCGYTEGEFSIIMYYGFVYKKDGNTYLWDEISEDEENYKIFLSKQEKPHVTNIPVIDMVLPIDNTWNESSFWDYYDNELKPALIELGITNNDLDYLKSSGAFVYKPNGQVYALLFDYPNDIVKFGDYKTAYNMFQYDNDPTHPYYLNDYKYIKSLEEINSQNYAYFYNPNFPIEPTKIIMSNHGIVNHIDIKNGNITNIVTDLPDGSSTTLSIPQHKTYIMACNSGSYPGGDGYLELEINENEVYNVLNEFKDFDWSTLSEHLDVCWSIIKRAVPHATIIRCSSYMGHKDVALRIAELIDNPNNRCYFINPHDIGYHNIFDSTVDSSMTCKTPEGMYQGGVQYLFEILQEYLYGYSSITNSINDMIRAIDRRIVKVEADSNGDDNAIIITGTEFGDDSPSLKRLDYLYVSDDSCTKLLLLEY